jgi:hypothetical protein
LNPAANAESSGGSIVCGVLQNAYVRAASATVSARDTKTCKAWIERVKARYE